MEKAYKRIEYSNENLRKNINYLIQRDNITKATLDKDFEMGEGSISRYCKIDGSVIEPKISVLNSLAKAFDVTIDDLINTDIEQKEIKEIENSQRKEVLFCKKLIKETKDNLCDWHKLNFYNDSFIAFEGFEGVITYSNFLEDNENFKSKFIYKEYNIEELNAFTTIINGNTQVVIIEYLDVDEDILYGYELYLIKSDGKVLPSCASHTRDEFPSDDIICDEIFYNILRDLYKTSHDYVTFGKDNFEKELIYDYYLEEVPF